MALSGYYEKKLTSRDRYYGVRWTATQNAATLQSYIHWEIYCKDSSGVGYPENDITMVINDTGGYSRYMQTMRFPGTIVTGTDIIQHPDSGSVTFEVELRVECGQNEVLFFEHNFTLDAINQASTLTAGSGTLGTATTLTVTKPHASFTHTITAKCGNLAAVTVCEKSSSTSVSFTPPINFAEANTTGTSISVTYTVTTWSGNTIVGTSQTRVNYQIPESVKPSCSITVSDATGWYSEFGSYIRDASKLRIQVTVTPSYGSPIRYYAGSANGESFTSATYTTDLIKNSGSNTISVTVTDARGRTGSATKSVSVTDYAKPSITKLTVQRCNSDGTANPNGDHVIATFSTSIKALSNHNTAEYSISYKKSTQSSYTTVSLTALSGRYTVTNSTYIFAADTSSSYDVKITATDKIYTSEKSAKASTGFTLMHFAISGTGIGIGKVSEVANTLDCGLKAHFGSELTEDLQTYSASLNALNNVTQKRFCLSSCSNTPVSGEEGFLEVFRINETSNIVYQRFTNLNGDTYLRTYTGSWSAWRSVGLRHNIDIPAIMIPSLNNTSNPQITSSYQEMFMDKNTAYSNEDYFTIAEHYIQCLKAGLYWISFCVSTSSISDGTVLSYGLRSSRPNYSTSDLKIFTHTASHTAESLSHAFLVNLRVNEQIRLAARTGASSDTAYICRSGASYINIMMLSDKSL